MGPKPSRARRMRDQRRNAVFLASSLALHAVLLGYLALHSLDDPRRYGDLAADAPLLFLDIEPRPLLRGERPRPPVDRPRREVAPQASRQVRRLDLDAAPPSPPAPRQVDAAAPPPPVDVEASRWRVAPDATGANIARSLRATSGCRSPTLLTASERAACDDRFGAQAARAAPIEGTGDPARDGRFAREGARALARYEARRAPLSGRPGNLQPHDCGGSNLGFSCAGSHLDPGFRHDKEDDLNATLGRDRGDPGRPRLPHAATRGD